MNRNVLAYALILYAVVLYGCSESPNVTNEVIATEISENGELVASVLKGEGDSNLVFSLFDVSTRTQIASKEIAIPRGYHGPLITIKWKSVNIIMVAVDHDFGEGSHIYEYEIHNDLFKRL